MRSAMCALFVVGVALGCGDGGKQPDFPALHPVTGVVLRGGSPVSGGVVQFHPESAGQDFLINSEVGSDGKFSLSTVRTTDKRGERRSGAPAGKYTVTYMPPLGDQTAGGSVDPIQLMQPVTVEAKANDLKLELPKKK